MRTRLKPTPAWFHSADPVAGRATERRTPGSRDRLQIIESAGAGNIQVEPVPPDVNEQLPPDVQPIVFHMVE
jgi:hypothetical protein